jgi:hypothetical protein
MSTQVASQNGDAHLQGAGELQSACLFEYADDSSDEMLNCMVCCSRGKL